MTDAPSPDQTFLAWRRGRLRWALGLTVALAAAWAYEPWCRSGPPLCLVRGLTGIPCPGCGMTRALCASSHGHWWQSVQFHWLGPVALAAMVLGVPLHLVEAVRGRPVTCLRQIIGSPWVAWMAAGVLMVRWCVLMTSMASTGQLRTDAGASPLGSLVISNAANQDSSTAKR